MAQQHLKLLATFHAKWMRDKWEIRFKKIVN